MKFNVKEAEDGELLKKGTAYIAPGGFHLKVKKVGTGLAVDWINPNCEMDIDLL